MTETSRTIYYVPIEGYRERYTMQWSAPDTGWIERHWKKIGQKYVRIDPKNVEIPKNISSGSVVDSIGRGIYSFAQISELLKLVPTMTDEDIIYFDDFWTPGIEGLAYALHLHNKKPSIYGFLHAQSVDEFDFTYPMANWIRPIEIGYNKIMTGTFVCCPFLRDLCINAQPPINNNIVVTGHPYCSEEVLERMPQKWNDFLNGKVPDSEYRRKNQIVWSSRWDVEKNPEFFLDLAHVCSRTIPDLKFVVCTSAPRIRSNKPALVDKLYQYLATHLNMELKENLTKEEYYEVLTNSKFQFNCASQDFVAITLLEAVTAGCFPIYPYYRSFPETFLELKKRRGMYTYDHLSLSSALELIQKRLHDENLWTHSQIMQRRWIYSRFDTSWIKMLYFMYYNSLPSSMADLNRPGTVFDNLSNQEKLAAICPMYEVR